MIYNDRTAVPRPDLNEPPPTRMILANRLVCHQFDRGLSNRVHCGGAASAGANTMSDLQAGVGRSEITPRSASPTPAGERRRISGPRLWICPYFAPPWCWPWATSGSR